MELLNIKQASSWASDYLKKNVTTSNISYLINYGRIKKIGNNGKVQVAKEDLIEYYKSIYGKREIDWKEQLGDDLNWALSFDYLKEKDTTKHVHRLHPYKGKFIPQLVEYFLDSHTDDFKKEVYFHKGDIILDPFCGSGTTLVAGKLKHRKVIGIDISKEAIEITKMRLSNPIKSESNLLKKGKESYNNVSDLVEKYLHGIEYIPVHANSGIDAILKTTYKNSPILIKIQKEDEALEDAIKKLANASKIKQAKKAFLIRTNDIHSLFEYDNNDKIIDVIDSPIYELNKLLSQKT